MHEVYMALWPVQIGCGTTINAEFYGLENNNFFFKIL